MRFTPLAAWLLALLLSTTLACGGDETVETDAGTVTLDREDDTMTLSLEGEEKLEMQTGENVALPEDFPDDVPVYPDATLVASMATPEGVMVSSESDADPKDVLAFYKQELGGEGWTVEAEMNMGPQRMISFAKGDRQVMISVGSEEGRTQISLTAGR